RIHLSGRAVGIGLRLDTPITALIPYLQHIDAIVVMGTEIGVKGRDLSGDACNRILELAGLLHRLSMRSRVPIIADGGIRKHTVPELRSAGADAIVPGSLVFQCKDLDGVFEWVHAVGNTP